jgi:hypothetical protein
VNNLPARRRYRVFKEQTWEALQSLKEIYHYHFINAQGPVAEVEGNILHELEYQSTLELDSRTRSFAAFPSRTKSSSARQMVKDGRL